MGSYPLNMPTRDDETGRYVADVADETVLDALDGLGAAGTRDVAEEIDMKYDTVYRRLRRLEDEGRVTRRKIGNANLWILADEPEVEA